MMPMDLLWPSSSLAAAAQGSASASEGLRAGMPFDSASRACPDASASDPFPAVAQQAVTDSGSRPAALAPSIGQGELRPAVESLAGAAIRKDAGRFLRGNVQAPSLSPEPHCYPASEPLSTRERTRRHYTYWRKR